MDTPSLMHLNKLKDDAIFTMITMNILKIILRIDIPPYMVRVMKQHDIQFMKDKITHTDYVQSVPDLIDLMIWAIGRITIEA